MIKAILIFSAILSLLLSQELKEALSNPETFKKGSLTILKKDEKQYEGRLTLEVKKETANEILELLVVDPVTKKEKIIPLYDNGLHGDEVAGDGFYSGTTFFTPGKTQKYYLGTRDSKYNTQVLFEYVLFKW